MSFRIYPVTSTELCHNSYEIKINGVDTPLNTARVSAIAFNRRWPGHQRSLDQTELINFVSFETDEPVTFEIKPKKPFEKAEIRPMELGIVPTVTDDGRIIFTLEKPAYFTVEPYGRSDALHIFADPAKTYDIDKNDKNVLYFGQGEHNVGMIYLESNQTLFIDEGAVVYACVRANDAENIKILGRGILDNSKNKEQILFEANEENNFSAVNNAVREHTVMLNYCTNIEIEGITIRDSLVYNIKPSGCENLDIRNVKIIGCWRYNSDGIDMHNCKNVNIDNCFLRTFDDAICVKGFDFFFAEDSEKATRDAIYRNGKCYDVFKNVHVSNCVIWNDWGKSLEIGAETRAEEIFDILFDSCHIIHACVNPLDCYNVDYADVHDVVYKNVSIEFDKIMPRPIIQKNDSDVYCHNDPEYTPFTICVEVSFHEEYSGGGKRRGKNRRITFENIRLYDDRKPKFRFIGHSSESGVSDITVKDFYLGGRKLTFADVDVEQNEFCSNINILL